MRAVFVLFALLIITAPVEASAFDRHAPQTGASESHSPQSRIVTRVVKRQRGRPATVVGRRPAGCPHAFCGCALSIKNFGKIIPALNIAANWKGFPVALPSPGMVAARTGHVFQLIAHVHGNIWKVWDANSGGGAIRIHDRSIAGYTIHNPHGALAAYNGRPGRHARRVRYARAG